MEKLTLSPVYTCCKSLKLSNNSMAGLEEDIVHGGKKKEEASSLLERKSLPFIIQGIILQICIIMFWISFSVNCGRDLFIIRNILKSGREET